MQKSLRLVLPLTALFLGLAGCKTGAAPAPEYAPMPAGETATVSFAPKPMSFVETDWLVDQANGTEADASHFKVRLVYNVETAQELLAAECVRANWTAACELAQRTVANVDPTSPQLQTANGRQRWEADLRQQFTEILFPCNAGVPLATVTGIVWRIGTTN